MKKLKSEIDEMISKDRLISEARKRMSAEERAQVDSIVENFVQNFILPIEELVDAAKNNPEVQTEIVKLLTKKEGGENESE